MKNIKPSFHLINGKNYLFSFIGPFVLSVLLFSVNYNSAEIASTSTLESVENSKTNSSLAAPMIIDPATDLVVDCNSSGNTMELADWLADNGGATAESIGCDSIVWSYSLSSTTNQCSNTITQSYIFTAMDTCNLSATTQADFIIQDSAAPILSGGENPEVECDNFGGNSDIALQAWLNNNGGLTAEDACSDAITWTNDFDPTDSFQSDCDNIGSYIVLFTAADDCGNSASEEQRFNIVDLTPPVFSNCDVPNIVVEALPESCVAFANFSLPIATDNCGSVNIAQIDNTGLTSGSSFPVGTTTLVWEATDACGNTETCVRKIIVNDHSSGPAIIAPPSITINNDLGFNGAIAHQIAPDSTFANCQDNAVVTYTITDPAGNDIACGLDDASGSRFPIGTSTITYTIQDQPLMLITEVVQSTSVNQIEITNFSSADVDISCLNISRMANVPGGMEVLDLPAGTVINAGETYVHSFSSALLVDTEACYSITFVNNIIDQVATNGFTGCSSFTGLVNSGDAHRTSVCDTDDSADWSIPNDCHPLNMGTLNPGLPMVSGNGTSTSLQSEPPATASATVEVTVLDIEAPSCSSIDTLIYSPEIIPVTIEGSGTCTRIEIPIPVNYTVSDVNVVNLSGTHPNMGNLRFQITSPSNTTVTLLENQCAGTSDFDLGFDNEAVPPVSDAPCVTPLGLGINYQAVTSLESFVGEKALGVWVLEIANTGTETGSVDNFILEINQFSPFNNLDTTLTNIPGQCDAIFNWQHPVIGDNCCGGTMTVDYSTTDGITLPVGGAVVEGSLASETFEVGTTTVSYTLTDTVGNTSSCSFLVTVEDTESPLVDCPSDITRIMGGGECGEHIAFSIGATDNCSVDSLWSFPESGSFFEVGQAVVTVYARDQSGNIDSCAFNITVNDYPNPAVGLFCNGSINVSLDASCGLCITADMLLEGGPYRCYDNYEINVYDCGNTNCPPIATSPCITLDHVDQTLIASVTDPITGNTCWGYVNVESYVVPEILPPPDEIIKCNMSSDTTMMGSPLLLSCELGVSYSYEDVYTDLGSCNDPIGMIERTWTVTNESNLSSTCVQTITIEAFALEDVVFPKDWNNIDTIALYCGDVINDPALSDPTNTGYPSLGDDPLIFGGECSFATNVNDVVYQVCNNSYEIHRSWSVVSMCLPLSSTNPINHTQIIRVLDTIPPVIEDCSVGITLSTNGVDCQVTLDPGVNGPAVFDECSGIASISVTSSTGSFDLPVGVHTMTYTAMDSCGNQASCIVPVTVTDNNPPVMVCASTYTFAIGNGDVVSIAEASFFNNGSYDDCGPVSLSVRRMNPLNCIDTDWTTNGAGVDVLPNGVIDEADQGALYNPAVPFSCCDVGMTHLVELLATDLEGNTNSCMIEVEVVDNLKPVITCADDVTYSCADFYNEPIDFPINGINNNPLFPSAYYVTLNGFGPADNDTTFVGYYQNALDNCSVVVYIRDEGALNDCGITDTSIKRFFTAVDGNGLTEVCVQNIFVENNSPFYILDTNCNDNVSDTDGVVWPCNYTVTCSDMNSSILPAITGAPILSNDGCDGLDVGYNDLIVPTANGSCSEIIRTWVVIDDCQYNVSVNPPIGIWSYEQRITVLDDTPPMIAGTTCVDQNFSVLTDNDNNISNGCTGLTSLELEVEDYCTNPEDMTYSYSIDLDNNGSIDLGGSTASVSNTTFGMGTHKINWTIEDGCGNVSTCDYLFNVEDNTPPLLEGMGDHTVALDFLGGLGASAVVSAADLDIGSTDECSSICEFRVVSPSLGAGQTTAPAGTSLNFHCGDVGMHSIDFWVGDCSGNWSYKTINIMVEDLNGLCNQPTANISGNISNEDMEGVANVEVSLGANAPGAFNSITTEVGGDFNFDFLPLSFNYTVSPNTTANPLNGVSTYDIVLISKHILQVQLLDSPYKQIAADVNVNGSITTLDIVELRKLILFITTEFPVNPASWVFVDSEFVFPNPANPWETIVPTTNSINDLTGDEIINFIGIKKGDVNGSANPDLLMDAESRSSGLLEFGVVDQLLERGKSYTIDVKAKTFKDIFGFQFTLDFDPSMIEFEDLKSGSLSDLSMANFGLSKLEDGAITASWNSQEATSLMDDEILFRLTFKANKNIRLADALQLNSRYTKAEAYNEDLELMDVAISYESEEEKNPEHYSFKLYQNQPNPFKAETEIQFSLPTASDIVFTIYDPSGKIVKKITGSYSKGLHKLNVNEAMLNRSGIYYYELATDKDVGVGRMLFVD